MPFPTNFIPLLTLTLLSLPSLPLAKQIDSLPYNSGFTLGPAAGSSSTNNDFPYHYYSTSAADFDGNCIQIGDGTKAKAVRLEVFKGTRIFVTLGPDAPKCTLDSDHWQSDGPWIWDDFSKYHNSTAKYIWGLRWDPTTDP